MAKYRTKTKPAGQMALQGMDLIETKPKAKPPEVGEAFEAFWQCYPRHVDKYGAKKAWVALMKEKPAIDVHDIMNGLRAQLPHYVNAGPYVPHPGTWLRHRRWLDKVEDLGPREESDAERLYRKMIDRYLTEGKI